MDQTTETPSTTSTPSPTFKQNWGHLAWTLPMIVCLTATSGRPASIVFFLTAELIQLELHARKHHPEHPILTKVGQLITGTFVIGTCAIMMVIGAEVVSSFGNILGLANLVLVEVLFSRIIHEREHNANNPRKFLAAALPLVLMAFGSFVLGAVLCW